MKTRTWVLECILVLALFCSPSSALAQSSFGTIADIETLGNAYSEAVDINNRGQIVGRSGGHAILWTLENGMEDLGTLGGESSAATHINERGDVIGNDYSTSRGFFWSRATGMLDLGTLGGDTSLPYAINNSGQVVGGSAYAPGSYGGHAFLWTKDEGMVDLGTLGGATSGAYDINDRGQVLGASDTGNGKAVPFLWTKETGMVRFLPPTGTAPQVGRINNRGEVIGRLGANAFYWSPERGLVDLGTLGGSWSAASDINDAGQVAGRSLTATGDTHAFLWTFDGGMQDLGALDARSLSIADINEAGVMVGWSGLVASLGFSEVATVASGQLGVRSLGVLGGRQSLATAINDRGQITGFSSLDASGVQHAVVWMTLTPTQQVELLIGDVQRLKEDGTLTSDQAAGLIQTLTSAAASFARGNTVVAVAKLGSFAKLVELFVHKNVLTAGQADELVEAADWILFQLAHSSGAAISADLSSYSTFLPILAQQ